MRAASGLLALMFVVTTGVAGAALHLCAMKGLFVRTCCCNDAHEGPPLQLAPIDDCCGAVISKSPHPPVAMSTAEAGVDAPPSMSLAFHFEELGSAQPTEAAWVPLARGSPGVQGPPLFVWNCSFLI